MSVRLASDNYGKQRVRLVKVTRHTDRHDIADITVGIRFEGDYEAVHLAGDNTACLPTDTMKNTVYAVAKQQPFEEIEGFGIALANHFLDTTAHVARIRIDLAERRWNRLILDGRPHSHAFTSGSDEKRIAAITGSRERSPIVESGIRELIVLKTAGSAFAGFFKDRYTTLEETNDRIFSSAISAVWKYEAPEADYNDVRERARTIILEAFAEHDSRSVQHTAYAIGEAVLESCSEISEIELSMPNKHHYLFDLAAFSLDNPNEIFVPVDEPYGLIEAVVKRG